MLFLLLFIHGSLLGLDVDLVILSGVESQPLNENWPAIQKHWKELTGKRAILALISKDVKTLMRCKKDVIRFPLQAGIPPQVQAQLLKLFVPSLFADKVCLTRDVSLIPLKKDYFSNYDMFFPRRNYLIGRVYKAGNAVLGSQNDHIALGSVFMRVYSVQANTIGERIRDYWVQVEDKNKDALHQNILKEIEAAKGFIPLKLRKEKLESNLRTLRNPGKVTKHILKTADEVLVEKAADYAELPSLFELLG